MIANKLKQIVSAESVILVYDGKEGRETEIVSDKGIFQCVTLGEGISADDFIQAQVASADIDARIQIVTADRDLARKLRSEKTKVKKIVNPLTFWKRYLPRLCGFKKPTPE